MDLLTIGAFARASRLSPKALRLYDELGLLIPARVDSITGYRLYAPDQLERAQLVAWLRRIGMPLARIRLVCELEPAAAAREVTAFWAQVETDVATRRDLATFLIDQLSRKATRSDAHPPQVQPAQLHSREAGRADVRESLGIRYAVLSDAGLVRASNQDAAYAGGRLLAVADGFGIAGATASRVAIETLKDLVADSDDGFAVGDLLNTLQDAVGQANRAIAGLTTADGPLNAEQLASLDQPGRPAPSGHSQEPSPPGPIAGTTLTAMLWTGSQLALVHIGDTRVYLLRDGEPFQITHDHSVVQAMIDDGRLSPAEADFHPQRALLLKALDGRTTSVPDVHLHDARLGDRYLLCSDGLSAVLAADDIHRVLATVTDPQQTVEELITMVRDAGAPDNVTGVVADVIELPQG